MKKKTYPTEVLDVTIKRITPEGYGYVKYIHPPERGSNGRGLTINVTNVVPGDVVRVTIPNAKGVVKQLWSMTNYCNQDRLGI